MLAVREKTARTFLMSPAPFMFTVLIDVGKRGQQILSAILKQITAKAKLLTSFSTSGRVEAATTSACNSCVAAALSDRVQV